MLRARTNHTSAVLNGEIYVLGGKGMLGNRWMVVARHRGLQRATALQGRRWRWWRWSATTPTTRAGQPSARPSNMSATSPPPAAWASCTWWAPAPSSTTRSPCSATTLCEVSTHQTPLPAPVALYSKPLGCSTAFGGQCGCQSISF